VKSSLSNALLVLTMVTLGLSLSLSPIAPVAAQLTAATGTVVAGTPVATSSAASATVVATSATVEASATPGATSTLGAIATNTRSALVPDLVLSATVNPATAAPGQSVTFVATVRNNGLTPSESASLSSQLPAGATVQSTAPGCVEDQLLGRTRCPVPALSTGQEASFAFTLQVTATSGRLTARFAVDVEGVLTENERFNNTAEASVTVVASTASPAPTATTGGVSTVPGPAATATPAPAEPTPLPAPAEPAPEPAPPAAATQLWLEILAPTPAYGPDDEVWWEAQPGEWYQVISVEADWALAYFDGDIPENAVWIQVDERVSIAAY
jgi:uncharacterized repeat protein (TIGR01451 family)